MTPYQIHLASIHESQDFRNKQQATIEETYLEEVKASRKVLHEAQKTCEHKNQSVKYVGGSRYRDAFSSENRCDDCNFLIWET